MRELLNNSSLRELLFSRKEDIIQSIGQGYKLATEFIKIMEMYDKDPDDVRHWIDGMYSCINQCYNIPGGYNNMMSMISNKLPSSIDSDIAKIIKNLHGDNFINSIKVDVQKKYKRHIPTINSFQYDNSYYIRLLGILYLILVGKERVDDIDLSYIWYNEFDSVAVNKININYVKPSEVKTVLYKFIFHLNGDQGVLSKFV